MVTKGAKRDILKLFERKSEITPLGSPLLEKSDFLGLKPGVGKIFRKLRHVHPLYLEL